jgi:hypothetical protein
MLTCVTMCLLRFRPTVQPASYSYYWLSMSKGGANRSRRLTSCLEQHAPAPDPDGADRIAEHGSLLELAANPASEAVGHIQACKPLALRALRKHCEAIHAECNLRGGTLSVIPGSACELLAEIDVESGHAVLTLYGQPVNPQRITHLLPGTCTAGELMFMSTKESVVQLVTFMRESTVCQGIPDLLACVHVGVWNGASAAVTPVYAHAPELPNSGEFFVHSVLGPRLRSSECPGSWVRWQMAAPPTAMRVKPGAKC